MSGAAGGGSPPGVPGAVLASGGSYEAAGAAWPAAPASALDLAPPPTDAGSRRRWSPSGKRSPGGSPKLPTESVTNIKAMMKLRRKLNQRKRERMAVPMPRGIDITLPYISDAWTEFQILDRAQNGWIVWEDAVWLVKKITNTAYKVNDLKSEVDDFDFDKSREGLSFELFAQWLARFQANQRREVRRTVKEIFEKADSDRSGTLHKEEFGYVVQKAKKLLNLESFDRDEEWASIKKVEQEFDIDDVSEEPKEEEISFSAFEAWWKDRAGIQEPDIPVLPEYMVMRISEKAKAQAGWRRVEGMQGIGQVLTGKGKSKPQVHWAELGSRLRTMVDMRRQWGNLHEMYDTRADSLYELHPLPRWVRDPDSNFSAVWDLTSVVLLLYVSITVPLRAGFEIDVELWSPTFFFDAFVDVYFIADLLMNFRTAYYDKHGMREERPWRMASAYVRGWFSIDLLSCLPLGYVGYFMDESEDSEENSANLRAIKAFRLIRLSKMLRLARIKRILTKYGNNVNLQSYINIGFTVFIILFLAHMLACFFYMLGSSNERFDTGVEINGWVTERKEAWCVQADLVTPCNETSSRIKQGEPGADITVGTMERYVASLYLVLNPLENCETTREKMFGIFAELIRDMILGLIASLMTAIQLAMATTDAEVATRLKGLKQWLEHKGIPKSQQAKTMEFFNELWATQPIDPESMFGQMPPAMRLTISTFLYKRFLGSIPIFRSLSDEVVAALCKAVTPLVALKGQEIIKEGQTGTEMYMVMSGEVEVLTGGQRLGFLSEGAFFGEVPVLDYTSGAERRTRTVRSVTDSTELCFITRNEMDALKEQYPELKARLNLFSRTGARSRTTGKLTRKSLKQVGLTRSEMDQCVQTYEEIKDAAKYVRSEKNWDDAQVIPFSMITAAVRLKKRAAEARARLAMARRLSPTNADKAEDGTGGPSVTFAGAAPTPPAGLAPAARRQTEPEPAPAGEPEPEPEPQPAALQAEIPAPAPAPAPKPASTAVPKRKPSSRTGGLDWGEIDKPTTPTHNQNRSSNVSAASSDIATVAQSVASLEHESGTRHTELQSLVGTQAAEIQGLHSKLDAMINMVSSMQQNQGNPGLTLRLP